MESLAHSGRASRGLGPQTYAAVKDFGRTYGYNNSGQVGVRTWNSLCKTGLSYSNGGWGYFPNVAVAMGCMNGVSYGKYSYVSWFGSSSIQ